VMLAPAAFREKSCDVLAVIPAASQSPAKDKSKRPPAGMHAKVGKSKKMAPIGRRYKKKCSKMPPCPYKRIKVSSSTSIRIKSGICLLSIRGAIVGKKEVQIPVWRPSVIQETLNIGNVICLWAERTFGQKLRASQLPQGVRCYAGNERGLKLSKHMPLRKIRRKLPLEDGRLSLYVKWPLANSGMSLDENAGTQLVKQSLALKRGMGETSTALATIGALVAAAEEPKKKKSFLCFAYLRDTCDDPDCPYPHFRP